MKLNSEMFRHRYNIPRSTESTLKKNGILPFEKVGNIVVYDTDVTDQLAHDGKLGGEAFIAINNSVKNNTAEEHY